MKEFPSWLKSMQNGTIGEARTRAFLIDRFWILERSVDIHGADFLIQRRLHDRNILDDTPPRFGVVQSKFSQNENTSHYINREWVVDRENEPRMEFFLLIHTGDEESQRMFLLTSKDISDDFHVNEDKGVFVVCTGKVFSSPKYQITNKKHCLDRMESFIQCAEFYKNRCFVFSRLSSIEPDFDAILPDYKEDIEHWFGSIPDLFKEQKKEAFDVILLIEEVHELLRRFVESVDPIKACAITDRLYNEFGTSISLPELFSRDFYYGTSDHKEMVDNMRKDGALDNYISTRDRMTYEIDAFLQTYSIADIDSNAIHQITVKYDPTNLGLVSIENSTSCIPENELFAEFSRIIEAREGSIILAWKIGLQVAKHGSIKMNECCINDIMGKIYALKYYDGEEILSSRS